MNERSGGESLCIFLQERQEEHAVPTWARPTADQSQLEGYYYNHHLFISGLIEVSTIRLSLRNRSFSILEGGSVS